MHKQTDTNLVIIEARLGYLKKIKRTKELHSWFCTRFPKRFIFKEAEVLLFRNRDFD